MHIWDQPILVSHSVPIIPQVISGAQWTRPGGKSSISPVSRATHLEPLSDALGDADRELCYLGRTHFAFLAVRFIFGLSFHNHLVQETEANSQEYGHMHSNTPVQRRQVVGGGGADASVQSDHFARKYFTRRMSTVTTYYNSPLCQD